MRRIKEKKERALGTKLFLKAERCNSPKCVMVRRPQKPGMHGKSRKRRAISDYGRQLQEKQKIQIYFGLNNRQMRCLFNESKENIVQILERRLDQVVFALGIARSSRIARQLISHGHIMVNNRKVTIPSYHVKITDVITIRPESKNLKIFEDLELRLKQYTPPSWLKLDKGSMKGECVAAKSEDSIFNFDINLVGQFYSR
ncbi:MAG: 30S ribosomal protein S4 [Patescibacteria group bacterium]|nr:30S ribosomal protein S4 [Patescibacteria group bacterium]